MLRASRQSFSANPFASLPPRCRRAVLETRILVHPPKSAHVQPRTRKRRNRIGIGTPRSHRRIHPNFPDRAARLWRYFMHKESPGAGSSRVFRMANGQGHFRGIARASDDRTLLALSRLPEIVSRGIRETSQQKRRVVPIGFHAAVAKEEDPPRFA